MAILLLLAAIVIAWLVFAGRAQERRPSARNTGAAISRALPERFVVFDLETTGLDARRHEIIEIGAIRVNRDGDWHDTFQALVRSSKPVSKRITELTGITNEMLHAEGEAIESVMSGFRDFVGDLPLVAFNASFDCAFLDAACSRIGHPVLTNRRRCALEHARAAWPGLRSYRLSALAEMGGLDLSNEHRALGDCRRAMIVYSSAAAVLGRA